MKEFIHESFKMDENKILNLEKHQDQEKKNQDQEKHHEQEHYTMINILNINTEEQTPRAETKSGDINTEAMNYVQKSDYQKGTKRSFLSKKLLPRL